MSHRFLQVGIALFLAAVAVCPATAQFQQPQTRPSPPQVSPYLNLLNRRTNPAINYFGIVRPQLQFNQAITQQQFQIDQLRQQGTVGQQLRQDIEQLPDRLRQDLAAQRPAPTPIPTFGNYSHYFNMPQSRR
jgi:hypothetical protein